jgi:hypothetical protein
MCRIQQRCLDTSDAQQHSMTVTVPVMHIPYNASLTLQHSIRQGCGGQITMLCCPARTASISHHLLLLMLLMSRLINQILS